MNQELIKFIELCLSDGIISDKEREVIFRKAKALGVPEDECEIILEGMASNSVSKQAPVNQNSNEAKNLIEIESIEIKQTEEHKNFTKNLTTQVINDTSGLQFEIQKIKGRIANAEQLIAEKISLHADVLDYLNNYSGNGKRFTKINENNFNSFNSQIDLRFKYQYDFQEWDWYYDHLNGFTIMVMKPEVKGAFTILINVFHGNGQRAYESIDTFDTNVHTASKMFKTIYSMKIGETHFNVNNSARGFFYKELKQLHNKVWPDREIFKETQLELLTLNEELQKLDFKLNWNYAFEKFIKSNENVLIDLLRADVIAQILNAKNSFVSTIEHKKSISLSKIESHILNKRKIILNTLLEFNEFRDSSIEISTYTSRLSVPPSISLQEFVDMVIIGVNELNILLYHFVNMMNSLLKNDLVSYNRIYQKLDELEIFNTKWENQIKEQLVNINTNMSSLIDRIDFLKDTIIEVGQNIVHGLQNLEYSTMNGFNDMKISVKGVNDSINFNNLLTGVQLYKMYQIKKELN
jgi:hypothetical protein